MRLSLMLLLIAVFSSTASVYSQATRLTLKLENARISEVFDAIEKQSEFYFFYNRDFFDDERIVSVDIENKRVEEVLDELLSGQPVSYEIFDRNILIKIPEAKLTAAQLKEQQQQQRVVSGKVTDTRSLPLPGVTIMVKGTSQGTITDAGGNYSIAGIQDNATLIFSFVGMRTQEMAVGTQTVVNITMEEIITELEEVVAVGYGTRKAGEITGSISKVSAEEISVKVPVDVSELLQGVSGVTAIKNHTPGGGASIRIRGLTTIHDNNPLWVVDGVVVGGGVTPDQIESITVLKDAAAQSIYGARAANGVIIVTTKHGRKNQPMQVNVNVKRGINTSVNSHELLNTRELGELRWLEAKNEGITGYSHVQYGSGTAPDIKDYIFPARAVEGDPGTNPSLYDRLMSHEDGDGTYLITRTNKEGTDWFKEISRNSLYQEYSIDISGGSEKATYSLQTGYMEEEGILKYTSYERYNIGSNVSYQPVNWLEFGNRTAGVFGHSHGNQGYMPVFYSYQISPYIPVYDIKGNFAGTQSPSEGGANNPLSMLYNDQWDNNRNISFSNHSYMKINFFEGLSFRTTYGISIGASDNRDLALVEREHALRATYPKLSESGSFGQAWTWINTLEYSKIIGLHNFTIMATTEATESNSRSRTASRSKFMFEDNLYMQLDVGESDIANSGNLSEWSLFSVLGRVNYIYADKYMIEGVIRRDGSSRFGKGNQYSTFPGVSLGWRIDKENFMADTNNWLDMMKLRVSYGQSGNDRIGNYNSYGTYASSTRYSYYPISGDSDFGYGTVGFYRKSLGNDHVKWETSTVYNGGLDASLFGHFNFSVDIWQRNTSGMLYDKQIPLVAGATTPPSVNVGDMENKGFDFEIGYRNSALNKELKYNLALTVSRYKNKIVKLSGNEEEFITGGRDNFARAENGTAYPEFYGYQIDGIFQTDEEADAHPKAFGANGTYNQAGHWIFRNVNDDDNVINADDRTYIGSPHPDFTAGLVINLSYKGFELSSQFYSSYGNDAVNYARWHTDFKWQNQSKRRLYESWGSPYLDDNKNAKMAKATLTQESPAHVQTSYFVEDASYLRMENLRLSYDLGKMFNAPDLKNLTIYGHVTNLFTITNYTGLDPEVYDSGGMNKGIDLAYWPTPRQFLIGLRIGL